MIKNRDVSIDYIRGLAILLVVGAHFIQGNFIHFSESNSNSRNIVEIIISFIMPLFFLLSGYVSALKRENISNLYLLLKYLKKKAVLLLLPKFIWACLFARAINHKAITIQTLFDDFMDLNKLWFLSTLFFVFVGFALYRYVSSKNDSCIAKLIGGGLGLFVIELVFLTIGKRDISLSSIVSILLYPSFFIIGYVFSYFSVIEKLKKYNCFLTVVFICMLFGMVNFELGGSTLINRFYKYLASIGFFFVAKECFQSLQIPHLISKYLALCSKHSLGIYCIHMFFIWDICKVSSDSVVIVLLLFSVVSLLISLGIITFAEFLSPLKNVSILLFGRVDKNRVG